MSEAIRAFGDSAEAFGDSAGRAGRRVADLVVALQVDPASVARLEEGLEAIRDRAIAFDHARICAGLIWPYRRPLATHWRLSAREAE